MITKKTLLLVSGCLSIVLFVSNYIGTYWICDNFFLGGHEGSCPDILYSAMMNFFPIIPFFLFSIITYKMRDEVYQAWLRFAYVWIPLSMLAIFLAPEYSADWMFPIVKGTVAFFSSLLFAGISLILIIYKYFASRRAPGQV
jgi:hypothetical protein